MSGDWKWDWWSENPIELVIVVLFVVFFFAFPGTGMGITPTADPNLPVTPAPK